MHDWSASTKSIQKYTYTKLSAPMFLYAENNLFR